jgi:hypothetical protein
MRQLSVMGPVTWPAEILVSCTCTVSVPDAVCVMVVQSCGLKTTCPGLEAP